MPLGSALGTTPIAGGPARSIPTVTITAPVGTITSTPATVSWTFSSATSRDQFQFQIRYLTLAGDQLFDTGLLFVADVPGVSTTGGSYTVPFLLSSGGYRVEVTAGDSTDLSLPTVQGFSVDIPTVSDTPDVEEVGSVFDVAIAGVGYVLADRLPDRPVRRTSVALQAPRFSTGDTPFNQAIDRYSFSTQLDWTGGAGQRTANRSDSDSTRFFRSDGINPFDDDCLQLLPATTNRDVSTAGYVFLTTANDKLVAVSATNAQAQVFPAGWGTSSDTSLKAGAQPCIGVATDGLFAYAALTNEVWKYDGSAWAIFGSAYSGSTLTDVGWCSDRLGVAYTNASGEGVLSTVGPAGVEEVAGGRFKFPNGTVKGIASGDGYLWFGVNMGRSGIVYAWSLGSTEAAFVSLRLPTDQVVERLFFYLGNLMVGARDSDGNVSLYRALNSGGALVPELLFVLEAQGVGRLDFTSRGALVFFTWTAMAESGDESGIGAIDLETSGFCSWSRPQGSVYDAGGTAGAVAVSCVNWAEELVFTVAAPTAAPSNVYIFSETAARRASGSLESSTDDLASALSKVFDELTVRADPIASANDAVDVEVSVNGGQSFTSLGELSGAGATSAVFDIGLTGSSVTTRLTLSAASGHGPCVRLVQVKLHPLTISDETVELPIDLGPDRVGLNGRPLRQDSDPLSLIRGLKSLIGSRVKFQDVDWPTTREANVWEVTAVETTSSGSFSRKKGARVEHDAVATVTLRRGS